MAIAKLIGRSVRPIFEHDCEDCRFLGRLDGKDLYVCKQGSTRDDPALVIRFGSEPAWNSAARIQDAQPGSAYALARELSRRNGEPNSYITG